MSLQESTSPIKVGQHDLATHLACDVHDPDGAVVVELSGLVTAVGIPTEEPHHGGATVGRLRQDHGGVGGD